MPFPPINIFSQHLDPEGTLAKLLERVPDAKVTRRADGTWSDVHLTFKRGWLKKALTMKARHDPDYYGGEDWSRQLSGMQGYFHTFPNAMERAGLFEYLPGLRFAFNFMLDGEPEEGDPRLALVYEMASQVHGVIFLPGQLLDASGRVILDADGEHDPEAQLPENHSLSVDGGVKNVLAAAGDDQEQLSDPPTQDQVFKRFLLMCSLVERGIMEGGATDAEECRDEMIALLKSNGAWETAEPWEVEALETPVDALPEKLQWKLPWQSEGAIILAWALKLAELPAYDQEVQVDGLYEIAQAAENGQLTPELRSLEELEELSSQMLAIHWRIRQFSLDGKAMDFVAFAPTAWCGPMDISLSRLKNNDLELHGQAIADSSPESLQRTGGIMEERRKALHWVLGHHPVYSQNDTST
jgi:hypothetical protein